MAVRVLAMGAEPVSVVFVEGMTVGGAIEEAGVEAGDRPLYLNAREASEDDTIRDGDAVILGPGTAAAKKITTGGDGRSVFLASVRWLARRWAAVVLPFRG